MIEGMPVVEAVGDMHLTPADELHGERMTIYVCTACPGGPVVTDADGHARAYHPAPSPQAGDRGMAEIIAWAREVATSPPYRRQQTMADRDLLRLAAAAELGVAYQAIAAAGAP